MKLAGFVIISIALCSCVRSPESVLHDERDRNDYNTIKVAGDVWMVENLKFIDSHIYNSGAWIWGSEEENYEKSQKLPESDNCIIYNCETANNVCPEGWHLSSVSEWDNLISYYKDLGNGTPDFHGFNLSFDGKARVYSKYCIFNGDTFWTSDSSDDYQTGVTIAIQLLFPGGIQCSYENSEKENAFYVRCVKN